MNKTFTARVRGSYGHWDVIEQFKKKKKKKLVHDFCNGRIADGIAELAAANGIYLHLIEILISGERGTVSLLQAC